MKKELAGNRIIKPRLHRHVAWIRPSDPTIEQLNSILTSPLSKETSAHDLLKRPEIHYHDLVERGEFLGHKDPSVSSQVEILVKYSGYIDRQTDEIKKLKKNEQVKLPTTIDYQSIVGPQISTYTFQRHLLGFCVI